MKKEIKDIWIEALVSGEYKQGNGVLRDNNDNFCCLGVLCDLAANEGIVDWANGFERHTVNGHGALPPLEVLEWAGLSSDIGNIKIEGSIRDVALTELNDNGYTFDEIASVIEGFYERL